MRLTQHLVIFARYPQLGTGKRRLAKGIGAVEALRFQREMLARTLRRLSLDKRWTTWLAITPDRSAPWPRSTGVLRQGGGDLGSRMARVARCLSPGSVVIIGCDIPSVTAGHIAAAFRLLGRREAVFGPASDGGYWLVGLRRRPRFIDPFKQVRWSTQFALADTLGNLDPEKVAFVEELSDVDDAEALRKSRLHALPW